MQNFDDNTGAEHAWAHYTSVEEGDLEELFSIACDTYLSGPESGIARGFTTYKNDNNVDVRWGKLKEGGYRLLAKGESAFIRFEIDSETQLEELLDGIISSIRILSEEELAVRNQPVDIKTLNLASLSLEELVTLQERITTRISQLRAANIPAGDVVTISGTGTTVLTNVNIPFSPSRVVIDSVSGLSLKMTGGKWDRNYSGKQHVDYLSESAVFEALIETKDDWNVTFEPITEGGTISIKGEGSYVGGFFDIPNTTIVTIKAKAGNLDNYMCNFSAQVIYNSGYGWTYDYHASELMTSNTTFEKDSILKPSKDTNQYFWYIDCDPGVEWEITVK